MFFLIIYSRFVFSQKREGILQSQQVLEEITGNTEYVITVIYIFFLSVSSHSCASETGSADIFQTDKLDSPGGKNYGIEKRVTNG